ncbi:hypothetical protein [Lysobacter sp. CA199]|uniref:hypothetical protein n=1 Tax=Lysobacter sp. CA199 TaxID=3455608 RepID=UPI003F8D2B55
MLAPLIGALLIWAHLIAFANFTGPHSPVHFEGAIVDKRIHRSKSTTYDVIVRDVGSGREVAVFIHGSVYRTVRIGDVASCDYRVGRWGLVYRWQHGEPRGCVFRRSASAAADEPSRCRPAAGCGER